jgi:hypothetical protein
MKGEENRLTGSSSDGADQNRGNSHGETTESGDEGQNTCIIRTSHGKNALEIRLKILKVDFREMADFMAYI